MKLVTDKAQVGKQLWLGPLGQAAEAPQGVERLHSRAGQYQGRLRRYTPVVDWSVGRVGPLGGQAWKLAMDLPMGARPNAQNTISKAGFIAMGP